MKTSNQEVLPTVYLQANITAKQPNKIRNSCVRYSSDTKLLGNKRKSSRVVEHSI